MQRKAKAIELLDARVVIKLKSYEGKPFLAREHWEVELLEVRVDSGLGAPLIFCVGCRVEGEAVYDDFSYRGAYIVHWA